MEVFAKINFDGQSLNAKFSINLMNIITRFSLNLVIMDIFRNFAQKFAYD